MLAHALHGELEARADRGAVVFALRELHLMRSRDEVAVLRREVARTLVLSERTVESHVRSILAKTGLTSRTELTRWYLQQPPR